MKSRIILSLIFSLLMAGSLFAANNIFTGAITDLWSNPNNWSEGRVPDASDTARIQNGVFCVVDYAAPPVDHINIRTGGNVLQLVDGAHLVSNDWAVISLNGGTPDNRDVMEILGGVFDCYSHFRVAGTEINIALGTGSDISIQSGDLTIDTTGMDLTTDAVGVLATLQQNIEQASSYQGYLGAQMNRLENTVEVMEISIEQAIKAESTISEADIATEVAKSASYQVQAEMGVAVQSQMHAINKTVLQLLG